MPKRTLAGKETELLRLWESGLTQKQIADALGVSRSTVSYELIRLGLRKRPAREAEVPVILNFITDSPLTGK